MPLTRQLPKKISHVVTALVLALTGTLATVPIASAYSGSGDGTFANPYLISSCAQFAEINDDLSAQYHLTQDLNCASANNAVRIMGVFEGVFDGNNHLLTINLTTSAANAHLSLFETINSNGVVQNLRLAGSVANSSPSAAGTAALVNSGYGLKVENVHSTVTVTSTSTSNVTAGLISSFQGGIAENVSVEANVTSSSYTGGVIGYAGCGSEIDDVSYTGTISTGSSAGGIAATDMCEGPGSTFTNISSSGTIIANNADSVGGTVGEAYSSHIENAYSSMTITGGRNHIGGLVGATDYGTAVVQGFAAGNITLSGENGGGLVGTLTDSSITRSFATGNVTGSNTSNYLGGLVGTSLYNTSAITNSYARGSISGENYVGGFIGQNSGTITNGYATGSVVGSGENVGGFSGDNYDTGTSDFAFWDAQTSGMNTSNGAASKTTTEMKDIDTFTTNLFDDSWNFTSIWMIGEHNDGYPCLSWSKYCTEGEDESEEPEVPATDDDNDGIATEVENAGPNGGDANNDGILDSEQTNVASFVNAVTNTYSVVELSDDCSLTNASALSESTNAKDAGYNYKTGLIDFSADCEASSVDVKVYQYGTKFDGLVLRKFNPNTGAYFNVPGASLITQVIDGQQVTIASYTIIDNGELDLDPAVGKIKDPVGLANLVVAAPNTGFKR